MMNYVVAYAASELHELVVMLVKDRPPHLKGVLMLPGGKIEEGENPFTAGIRELREETGLEVTGGEIMGSLSGTKSFITYVRYELPYGVWNKDFQPRKEETEKPMWVSPTSVLEDERLMPNLRLICPLIRLGVKGWHIKDETGDWRTKFRHKLYVTLPDNSMVYEITVRGMGSEEEE
jgi:8-oxo-dGTP pyrophosphatase MutT (NUDIX family)